jgi:pilus assembly protein CpaC
MPNIVREEKDTVRRNGPRAVCLWVGVVLCALLLSLCFTAEARGQAGDAPKGAVLEVSVVDMAAESQRISIPLNRSAIVRTTIAIDRADVVAAEIVEAQAISPTEILLTGKSYGRTNVVLWDPQNRQYVLDVTVELDLQALNDALQQIDPQSTAQANSVLGNIVLTGTVSGGERAERMIEIANLFLSAGRATGATTAVQNHLDIAGEQQVLLRCTVAEVNRSATRQLGIDGFLAGDDFRDAFVVNQLSGVNPINLGAAGNVNVTDTIPFLTGEGGVPLFPDVPISLGFPRVQMQLFIRALADNSLLKVLAEPNLVAISGETASFLAGGEFPVPVPQGNQTVTIEYREYGVRLNFTPIVKAHQRIRLKVRPEISELDFTAAARVEGLIVPGLSSRSAETTVELGDGQTIAIAGLLSEEIRGVTSELPGIGEIPILGALFRSVEYQRSNSELVVLVTPEIVSPMEPHQVPELPGSDIVEPTDWELYALGKLEGKPRDAGAEEPVTTEGGQPSEQAPSDPDQMSVHGPWGHASEGETQ